MTGLYTTVGLPSPLTNQQLFYLLVPQCILASIISGGVNFALAVAMYRTTSKQIRIWPLAHSSSSGLCLILAYVREDTVAGDCAVTTFIQGTITFVAVSALVHNDLRLKRIDPFPRPWPHTTLGRLPSVDEGKARTWVGRLARRFHNEQGLARGLHFFSGSDAQDLLDFSIPKKQLAQRWLLGVWKGTVMSALLWFIWWPITIAIIAPLYGGRNLTHTWVAPITKLLYGFTLALLQNPICACIALGAEDACRLHLRDHQRERWKTLSNANVTLNEKPRQSIQLQDAIASARQSLELGTRTRPPSIEITASRSSLNLDPSRRSSLDRSRTPSRSSSTHMSRHNSLDGSRGITAAMEDPPLRSPRHSLDSARDRLQDLRPSLSIRRRSEHNPRRLSIVQQGVAREYPAQPPAALLADSSRDRRSSHF